MSERNEDIGNSGEWVLVDPSVRRGFGAVHSLAIEGAFNEGMVVVIPPGIAPIPGLRIKRIDLECSISRILRSPSREQTERWRDMSPEDIIREVENYIRGYAQTRGLDVSEKSSTPGVE